MFQIMVLFLALLAIHTLFAIKSKIISILIAFILALALVIQLSSIILTGEVANYRFYENFNVKDVLSVADFFGKEGILLAIILGLTTFLIHYLSKQFHKYSKKKIISIGVVFAGIVLMSLNDGILKNAYITLQLKFADDTSFTQALQTLKINENEYVKKGDVEALKGKNIIVLSLESLEKGYLSDKLKQLTPNLRRLSQEHTLLKMEQCPAGGWTSASMYIAMTGIPAYFNNEGNSVFQNSIDNKLTTLPDVLKSAGYDLQYFIGKKKYSGIDDVLTSLGFTVKSEEDFATKYQEVSWGIQDMDLFKEFKKELLLKKNNTKPFAFFLSTIGTHFPNGVPDSRVDSLLPSQKSRLELMASATDYYVGDLVRFLRAEKMLENTVFFIYPDHLLMGKNSRVIEDFDERSLYFLTNANIKKLAIDPNKSVYQIDVPKLILQGAEVKNNAKFLTDFIANTDKNKFLKKNAKSILQLNAAALTTLNLKEGFTVTQNLEDDTFAIKNDEDVVILQKKMPSFDESHRILLDENLKPFSNFTYAFKTKTNIIKESHLDVFKTNGTLFVSLNGSRNFGVSKRSAKNIEFSKEDIELFEAANVVEKNTITISSNSWNSKAKSIFNVENKTESITRGMTILVLNAQSQLDFKTFDTHGSVTETASFLTTIKTLENNKSPYIILAHDSAAKLLQPHTEEIEEIGLQKLSKLKDRQAYVYYNFDGNSVEQVNDMAINLRLALPKNIKNTKLYFSEPKITFKPNVNRYIAHAGGEIDGLKYTNSLDALNHSYQLGFRLLELDISVTSDGHFVATHDWNHWKKETSFKGNVPVTLAEFNKHKIRGKYKTLAMQGINKWFEDHSDALLVTDKINTPIAFAEQFIDRTRLMMELFDLKAVNKALNNGLTPIVSEKAIGEIKDDVINYLVTHKINHVGLSRRAIASKKEFLKKCIENNIKVYVYHVNFDAGKDEKYVHQNEIGLVYGMYADKWLSDFIQ